MNTLDSSCRAVRRPLTAAPAFQMSLRRNDLWRVKLEGKPLPIRCLRGALWITRENRPDDLVVAAGQACELDGRGLALVSAFSDAEFRVGSGAS